MDRMNSMFMDDVTLVDAARTGDVETVRRLLNEGCDIDAFQGHENPLTISAWRGHAKVVQLLLARHARLDVTDAEGRSLVKLAEMGGDPEVAAMIRAAGLGLRPQAPAPSPTPDQAPLPALASSPL